MEHLISEVKNTPIPLLLVVVGIALVGVGFVTKIGEISVEPTLKPWAIFFGLFILATGVVLSFHAEQTLEILSNYDSPGNDIAQLPDYSKEQCINKCRNDKGCLAVVFTPSVIPGNNNCWLKKQLNNPLTEDLSRTIIKIR